MANVVRPRVPSATGNGERQTRLNFQPIRRAPDDAPPNSTSTTPPSVATRRTSKGSQLLALGDDEKSVKQITLTPPKPAAATAAAPAAAAPLSRINSRKRPLADATTPDTRPPTKITVTQPHGELLRITNGVPAPIGIDADDVPSARSTPRPGSAGKTTPAAGPQDKRSLRSHDGGSRLKSDLATYFASYDDIIAGVSKPAEFLDYDTPIYILDEPIRPTSPRASRSSLSPTRSRKRKASPAPDTPSHSTTFHVLDYASSLNSVCNDAASDPLADAFYFPHHRRAERKEKQLRNIEKERAMHEKLQLERLLDGLQGPDWLKVMGITGVTDGERKDWEPKRDFFIKEVEALVDKFRIWKEEEKRLRAEKEAAAAAAEESSEEEESEEDEKELPTRTKTPVPRRPPRPHGFLLPFIPPEPTTPFLGFYAKTPHLRAAALGKNRHGRNLTAFGLPIPEPEEREFEVPDEFKDPNVMRDNARQRRRRMRESRGEAKD
ncbi:hypothetical protein HBH56_168730 [Parastagonospora nodorum]|uniref:Something about silencing protein 4 domain-containing protein n=1 Tax=Phaeosphaeria nodorum (strain SN15 / ATCC MYA-4574 / FGSC 10173) TaxID=321614 RepID=A0A7U2I1T9_PHANO|nr:hypothetical protein HBH56_168730 [Parastagonospora nodorum]QRC98713.1 hypothetical protein JI435_047550 [Parastagonospora nodorum SN15]KAH3936517.1 hypothetical protein HBH54_031820 [Parastagonospora nodorum]KAH3948330.1 hypothetical protein HBH53_106590 [Parastagonospora nodorum]KAH3989873.1 hypothetical protein HBH52_011480 [Parastagonospora nodorum]